MIPGDDLGTDFLSEADLPSAASPASPRTADAGSTDSRSRASHESTTARLIEIVPAAERRPDNTTARSAAAAAGRAGETRRVADVAIPAALQLLAATASSARLVLAGAVRRIHSNLLLAGSYARRLRAATATLGISAASVGRRAFRRGLPVLVRVGSGLRLQMRAVTSGAGSRLRLERRRAVTWAAGSRRRFEACRTASLGLLLGLRRAGAFRPRIVWPVMPPVAAAFLGGVAVGAAAMWLAPNAGAGSGTRGSLDAEIQTEAAGVALLATTGTPMSAPAAPVAATGIVQLAALTDSGDPEPGDANASVKPATSDRDVASRPEAAVERRFRGSLTVRSRPAGASVFINGRPVGKTPLVLRNQTVGSRSVRITLDGHEVWSTAARVVAYQQSVVQANLRQLPGEAGARQ